MADDGDDGAAVGNAEKVGAVRVSDDDDDSPLGDADSAAVAGRIAAGAKIADPHEAINCCCTTQAATGLSSPVFFAVDVMCIGRSCSLSGLGCRLMKTSQTKIQCGLFSIFR